MSPGSPGIGFGGVQNPSSSDGTSRSAPKSLISFFSFFRTGTIGDEHFSETQPDRRVGIVVVEANVVVEATVVVGVTVVVETNVVVGVTVVVEANVVVEVTVVVEANVVVEVTVVVGVTVVVEATSEDPPQAEASKRKQKLTLINFIPKFVTYEKGIKI